MLLSSNGLWELIDVLATVATSARSGRQFTIKFGNWCGDRLGFYCWNDKVDAGWIDVDWLHYNYDGPKG